MSAKENKSVEELLQNLKSTILKREVKNFDEVHESKKSNEFSTKEINVSDIVKEMVSKKLDEILENEIEKYFSENLEFNQKISKIIEEVVQKRSVWFEKILKEAIQQKLDSIIN